MNSVKIRKILFVLLSFTTVLLPRHSTGADWVTHEYATRSGKSLFITESHPAGQSLSDITLQSSGFEHELSETLRDRDPIKNIHVADLNGDGFDEFYIITVSAGSGSYGTVIGLASNRDKSLSIIHFPEIQEGDARFDGYMGHDTFEISDGKVIRSFPVYLPSDDNSKATGGRRRLTYDLFPGEAAWQLMLTGTED